MIFHACDDVKIRPENERYDTERERKRRSQRAVVSRP